ncbi:MAG: 5-formyltetrahydrofolate cyclo-ligase [Lachnospiraceae bacterium]|nr:5-formyltetrahydrofolate cyclo-ligase [Lachnospiraceae bacterium]
MASDKAVLRRAILTRRSELLEADRRRLSDIICGKILSLKQYAEAKTIFAYAPANGEVDVLPVIRDALLEGRRVAFPKCFGRGEMYFYSVSCLDELTEGRYGILAPSENCPKIDVTEGLMLVPGVCFDRNLNRIGYGGGYYDRYVGLSQNVTYVAPAFELQMCERISPEPHDKRPDMVITEQLVYKNNDLGRFENV